MPPKITRGVAIGAKFAPSLANLLMAKWEEDVIYALKRPELVLWARYIDDTLLLWKGDCESLDEFMSCLNSNDKGIRLSYEASPTSIHFLDLEITVVDKHLEFKTYFKPTDQNGYIPVDSCHHSQWLKSVPRSQFLRLRRNCTLTEDFLIQSVMLKNRFLEKGYKSIDLDTETNRISKLDRVSLLKARPKTAMDNKFGWSFFTTYSVQSRQIKEIFKKHWGILQNDRFLGPAIPERAGVIFRGAQSIQGQIAPVIDPPKTSLSYNNVRATIHVEGAMFVIIMFVIDGGVILFNLRSLNAFTLWNISPHVPPNL